MDSISNIDLLSVAIAISSNLILGFMVFFSDKKSATNRLFLIQTIILSVWSFANYASYQIKEPVLALFLVRSVLFLAIPNSVVFLFLMHTFPSRTLRMSKKVFVLLLIVMFLTMIIALSPILFSEIIVSESGAPVPIVGPGIIPFILLAILSIPVGIYYLFCNYLKTGLAEKHQQILLLYGVTLMFLLIVVFDFIFPALLGNSRFIPLSAVFTLPFVILTAYAIFRHGLLKVKIVAAQILTFVLSIVTFLEIIFARDNQTLIFRSSVFVLVLCFGILLIRSVIREVESREKIEKQEKEMEAINAKLGIANEKLKELDKQKTEFVGFASHQLRSPLTAIKGYASLILEGDYGEISDELRHAAQIIFDSTNTLVTVVSDYLNVSSIELGQMKYDFKVFDLKDLVKSVTEELKQNVEKTGLKLKFECDTTNSFPVLADHEKIKQVMMNIIDNSAKYTPKGEVTISLTKNSPGKILFAVKDTGIGISKDTIPKLFAKFTRAKNANEANMRGTGLGLFIAREIIVAHNGRIWVESSGEGKGSQFYVELNEKNS